MSSAADQGAPLTVQSAQVGIGGRCKAGFWAPVWLTLKAGRGGAKGHVELVIPDGDRTPVVFRSEAGVIDLSADQQTELLLYAKIGPATAPISVQLRDDERISWTATLSNVPPRLVETQYLVVSIGPSIGLPKAAASIKQPDEVSYIGVEVAKARDLPDRWWGYEGVDAVVLTASDATLLEGLSESQTHALREFVLLGGRLVVGMGVKGKELLADVSRWRWLAPGEFVEVSPLRDPAGLESFAGSELPWESDDFQKNRPLVTRIRDTDGVVLVEESAAVTAGPLIVRSAFGLGERIFVGLDLDHPGFARWPGRSRMLASLLTAGGRERDGTETNAGRGVTHLGYTDLVGQLRAALDQFPGVTLVSFTTVAILTGVFLLFVGPGDFLLLTWLNLPRQATWLTFAAVSLAMGVVAWFLSADAHGSRTRINQLEIVDYDVEQQIVRGTAVAHLYSARAARFDLGLSVLPTEGVFQRVTDGRLAWQGLPGDSLGGLQSRQVALSSADPYSLAVDGSPGLNHLTVQTASSKSLSVRWWSVASDPAFNQSKLVRDEYGQLAGELVNPLPVEITDCLVAFEDRLYRLKGKTLRPGQTVRMADEDPLNLEARLTERFVLDSKDVSTQWDQASTDIPRIARMLMFHEAARGAGYTGLSHRYQPYLDLTGHLQCGRAVLIGRAARPVARLTSAGQPLVATEETQAWTWWRVVLLVKPFTPTRAKP